MTEKILWINRIIAIVTYCICVYICERFKLAPWYVFTFAIFYLIGLNFLLEIIKVLLK